MWRIGAAQRGAGCVQCLPSPAEAAGNSLRLVKGMCSNFGCNCIFSVNDRTRACMTSYAPWNAIACIA